MDKSADAYRTISEVAEELKLPQHVLRFWETRFPQVRPMKRGGNRRFYRPEDVELLRAIRALLYADGYTIKGVQRILKQEGPRAVAGLAQSTSRRGPASPVDAPLSHSDLQALFSDMPPGPNEAETEDPDPMSDEPGAAAAVPGASAPWAAKVHPAAPASRSVPTGYASGDMADRLQAVLYDLSECERLLGAARG